MYGTFHIALSLILIEGKNVLRSCVAITTLLHSEGHSEATSVGNNRTRIAQFLTFHFWKKKEMGKTPWDFVKHTISILPGTASYINKLDSWWGLLCSAQ